MIILRGKYFYSPFVIIRIYKKICAYMLMWMKYNKNILTFGTNINFTVKT